MADLPRAPKGVTIVRANGKRVPVEMRYVGAEPGEDGEPMHLWESTQEIPGEPGDKVHIDLLPGRTGVDVRRTLPIERTT